MIKLLEILRKKVVATKENRTKVYFQDADNLYPNRMKGLIESSPTAFRSANLMSKFIVGKGLVNENLYNKVIDKTLNLDTYDFSQVLAKQLAYHNGFFVHISYKYQDGLIVPAYSKVIPFEDGRISRTDDDGYFGKLLVKDWENSGGYSNKSNKLKEYYSFTTKQEDLIEQIKDNWKNEKKGKDFDLIEAIKIFKGQYYYYNPNVGDIYPLSLIHAVQNDCDTEYRIGNYTNVSFRKGLLGKTIVLTDGLTEEQEYEVEEVFQNFLGDDNVGDMVFYPTELADGKTFDDVLKVVQLAPQYDEKFFDATIPRLRKSIMASFNNIPEPLVTSSDSALFGTNSETYEEMKKFYTEQNDEQRKAIQKFFFDVYNLEVDFITFGSDMAEVIDEETLIKE